MLFTVRHLPKVSMVTSNYIHQIVKKKIDITALFGIKTGLEFEVRLFGHKLKQRLSKALKSVM